MFRLKIHTNTERMPEILTPLGQTISEALDQNDISVSGATVSFNGRILGASDFGKSFDDVGAAEGQTGILSIVVKAASAC